MPILEKLKADPEEFVRKSVANNLNDISKDHPELVLDICIRWQGNSKNTDWIIKHAMLLFGFANPELMQVQELQFSNNAPKIGEDITFSFNLNLEIKQKQKVRLEYIVHFIKANGKPSPKIFQIKEVGMQPGKHSITKKHTFKNMSTRKHYTGEHKFEVVVNGEVKADGIIELG